MFVTNCIFFYNVRGSVKLNLLELTRKKQFSHVEETSSSFIHWPVGNSSGEFRILK